MKKHGNHNSSDKTGVLYRERGSAIVFLMMLLAMGAGSGLYTSLALDKSQDRYRQRMAEVAALQKTKRALIAHTIMYSDNYAPTGAGPGHFPCPDRDPVRDGNDRNDGPNPPCRRLTSNYGRLPRFTVTSDPVKTTVLDAAGRSAGIKQLEFYYPRSLMEQPMWYAVSPAFINNPSNTVLNAGTRGQFEVDLLPEIVAVVFAPGKELSRLGQDRSSDSISNYLDGSNATMDGRFSHTSGTNGNDLVAHIDTSDFMPLVVVRVAGFVKEWLEDYSRQFCGLPDQECFPPALRGEDCIEGQTPGQLALFSATCTQGVVRNGKLDGVDAYRHWYVRNQWNKQIGYLRDPLCKLADPGVCSVRIESVQPWTANTSSVAVSEELFKPLVTVAVRPASIHSDEI